MSIWLLGNILMGILLISIIAAIIMVKLYPLEDKLKYKSEDYYLYLKPQRIIFSKLTNDYIHCLDYSKEEILEYMIVTMTRNRHLKHCYFYKKEQLHLGEMKETNLLESVIENKLDNLIEYTVITYENSADSSLALSISFTNQRSPIKLNQGSFLFITSGKENEYSIIEERKGTLTKYHFSLFFPYNGHLLDQVRLHRENVNERFGKMHKNSQPKNKYILLK